MEIIPKPRYQFDEFCVDVPERQLLRRGDAIPLPPKVFDTLLVFLENAGRLLEKDFLMSQIWPESFVEESSLTQYIFQLRKALGEDGNGVRYIETVPKRGYRFLAQVEKISQVLLPETNGNHVSPLTPSNGQNHLPGTNGSMNGSALAFAPMPAATLASVALQQTAFAPRKSLRKNALAGLSIFALFLAGFYVALKLFGHRTANARAAQITKLTTNGKAVNPALSPDGKYVAYVLEEAGKQGIWVRQVAASGTVQVVPPAEMDYQGISFSLDGNFIYYVAYQRPKNIAMLYRVPVLGGTPTKILADVDSVVTFAPDGKRLAFIRNNLEQMNNAVVIANVDGTNEQILATRKFPYAYSSDGPAWSPDGQMIASAMKGVEGGKPFMSVIGIQIADKKEIALSSKSWSRIGQVAWRKDGKGLVAVARPLQAAMLVNQIWYLPVPYDEPHRVTNDLANYTSLSISAQADKIAALQSTKASHFWIVPDQDANRAQQLSSFSIDNFSENMGLNWLADGQLLFGSFANGNTDLWSMNLSGTQQKQLTMEKSDDLQPTVSADGRYIAFLSDRAGMFNIWRMNADGSNPVQLTKGEGEYSPSFSPDGKWIVYSGLEQGMFSLWKVPAEGGDPIQLSCDTASRPAVSPDSKSIAHLRLDPKSYRMKLSVMPMEGGDNVQMLETIIPEPHLINWSPDGKMLTYIDTRDGVSNLWGQPLDGSTPKQLTTFKNDQIFRYAWSKDGKSLALERGFYMNDVVLISDYSAN